jgi:hypothetical protein
MKKIVLYFLFLITVNQLFAQSSVYKSIQALNTDLDLDKRKRNESFIQGTPYAKEDNSIGFFYQKNKMVLKAPTRLNNFRNNFELVIDGKSYTIVENAFDSIVVDSATYIFRTFNKDGKTLPRIVKIIDSQAGNTIYVYRGVEFQEEVKAGGYIDFKPAHYEWEDPIYLFEKGNNLMLLNNFKGLSAAFPGKENEIKKYIKENRINKNKPDELKMLLRYISRF